MISIHTDPLPGGEPSAARPDAGSSLIEVMIAGILGVVVLGSVLAMAVRQGTHRQVNLETSLAMSAAMSSLEAVRSVEFSALPGLDGSGFDVPGINGQPAGLQPQSGDADGLPGSLAVVVDRTAAGAVLYRVTARVDWNGASGDRSLSLESLVGERK